MEAGEVVEVNARVCFNFSGPKMIIRFILGKTVFSMLIFGPAFKHLNSSVSERRKNRQ